MQGVVTLLQHPAQLAALKAEPNRLVAQFVEELCRFHTGSALAMKRTAKEDVELRGVTIKKGEGIIASNQSANRDEEIWGENADEFDIFRKWPVGKDPLGYGFGPHRCIAEGLAKAELTAVFSEYSSMCFGCWLDVHDHVLTSCPAATLFKKMPDLKLAVPFDKVNYSPLHKDVGIVDLPVTW